MLSFHSIPKAELAGLLRQLEARYEAFKARGLKLDMTRGKPSSEPLDLAGALLDRPGLSRAAATLSVSTPSTVARATSWS